MTTTWLLSRILLLWLLAIAVMDLRSRKVRNWMVLAGLATGTLALFSGVQPFWVEPWDGLLGALVAFAVLLMNALTPVIDRYIRPRILGRNWRGTPLDPDMERAKA